MSKELQVRRGRERETWLDEHAKKKIRGLVEAFVEKGNAKRLGKEVSCAMVLHVKNDARIVYSS